MTTKSITTTCTVGACTRLHVARGLCRVHYKQQRKDNPGFVVQPQRRGAVCDIAGCESLHAAKGLCSRHYQISRKHGTPLYVRDATELTCSIAGCISLNITRGLCPLHYGRLQRHGDPLIRGKELWDGRCRKCKSVGPFYSNSRVCVPCTKVKAAAWRTTNRDKDREQKARSCRAMHQRRRSIVLKAYGGKCACCTESEPAFLALDHKDGAGNAHRRSLHKNGKNAGGSTRIYTWVIRNNFPESFQLLCHNCNFAKSHNPGGCPHNTEAGRSTHSINSKLVFLPLAAGTRTDVPEVLQPYRRYPTTGDAE